MSNFINSHMISPTGILRSQWNTVSANVAEQAHYSRTAVDRSVKKEGNRNINDRFGFTFDIGHAAFTFMQIKQRIMEQRLKSKREQTVRTFWVWQQGAWMIRSLKKQQGREQGWREQWKITQHGWFEKDRLAVCERNGCHKICAC